MHRIMKYILGKKLGMTTIYNDDGAQNVTLIDCADNTVCGIRTKDIDQYEAVCLEVPKTAKKKHRREFRETESTLKVGDEVTVDIFESGEKVSVSGVSKGKGFQGVVKRHGFAGGPATHGHRHALRSPGSIGSAYPQHVIKGKRMAGRMGSDRITTKNITVVQIDIEKNIIALKGAVPGVTGRIVEVHTQ